MASDEQFRMYVMEVLGELKTDMKGIVGNGQPGRLNKLEEKVSRHDWYLALGIGGAFVIGYLIDHGPFFLHLVGK